MSEAEELARRFAALDEEIAALRAACAGLEGRLGVLGAAVESVEAVVQRLSDDLKRGARTL